MTRWLDYLTPVEITTEVLDHFSHFMEVSSQEDYGGQRRVCERE